MRKVNHPLLVCRSDLRPVPSHSSPGGGGENYTVPMRR